MSRKDYKAIAEIISGLNFDSRNLAHIGGLFALELGSRYENFDSEIFEGYLMKILLRKSLQEGGVIHTYRHAKKSIR